MKEFTITINKDGSSEISLKGYEEKSPELARIIEEASGGKVTRQWNPGAHAHVVDGRKVYHSH